MAVKTWVGNNAGNIGDWDTAANWSPSGVPVSTDDVIFANNSQNVSSGLDQSAVTLASLTIDQSYTGLIEDSQDAFLEIGATILEIGQIRGVGTQTGSKRLNIDLGIVESTVTIYNSATRGIDANRSPIRLRALKNTTDISIFGGSVAISDDSSNSTTIRDFICNEKGSVVIGESVTLTDYTQSGGNVTAYSSILGTINLKGGTLNLYDSAAGASTMGTVNSYESSFLNHFASGTITALNLLGGTVDLTRTQKAKTVTTYTATAGIFTTDSGTITLTNIAIPSNTQQQISYR